MDKYKYLVVRFFCHYVEEIVFRCNTIEKAKDLEYALYENEDKSLKHKKSIKLDIIAKSGLHLISLFPAIK